MSDSRDLRLALAGMLALAAAMGIGRFAFTPVLPMMQRDGLLDLQAAGWLASANYLGYFIGALSAVWMRAQPRRVPALLVLIAVLTAGMGLTDAFAAQLLLRTSAGVASAWALVFSTSAIFSRLAAAGRRDLGGVVYGGVGLGTTLSGLLCLVFLALDWSAASTWIALGALALASAILVRPAFAGYAAGAAAPAPVAADTSPAARRDVRLLVLAYGLYGFGYIVPATFLPAMARTLVPDPMVYGWTWPVFGAAAFASTLVAARLARRLSNRRLWLRCHLLMAAGVAMPVLLPGPVGIVLAALAVGATFVVITMIGMQEALRVAPGNAAALMAAMTSAFALGQIAGPLLVSLLAGSGSAVAAALLAACAALLAGAAILAWAAPGD